MNDLKLIRKLVNLTVCFAFFIVLLGAYTRLTDAGLGCPDWPGCYGQLIVSPSMDKDLPLSAPGELQKAWTEMLHRYGAGILCLTVFFLAAWNLFLPRELKARHFKSYIPYFLVLLIIFQAMLGMWTVTMKLLPIVVMGHFLGGMLIFSSLIYFRWQISLRPKQESGPYFLKYAVLSGMILLFIQIALGAWVSSNYAGIACMGFPSCNGSLWPDLHIWEAFNPLAGLDQNHQGGLLDPQLRVTIQFVHRLFALMVASYLLLLSAALLYWTACPLMRRMTFLMLFVLFMQCLIGILNVVYSLPIFLALAHSGMAALLLAVVLGIYYLSVTGSRCVHGT